MVEQLVWEGVESLLDQYVKVRSNDVVVILYTSDSHESAAWVSAALQIRGIQLKRVWMAPLRDTGLADRLLAALPPPADLTGRLVVMSFERDTMSHDQVISAALASYDSGMYCVFRAIGAGSELFSGPLRASPDELSARNTALLSRCRSAESLRIKTSGGTDLKVTLEHRHIWISNHGTARTGGVVILPSGEIATFPASIDGIFVADFAFNINLLTDLDARLHAHPVFVHIEDGCAVKYECKSPVTASFLDACFARENACRVGELGFGTNFAVDAAVAMNSHINERRPGIHLGFGQHNQPLSIVDYQCTIHIDLIAKGGLVWFDDDLNPFDLENIVPASSPHPQGLREGDISSPIAEILRDGDCCGSSIQS